MKKIYDFFIGVMNKYTTGVPFLIWGFYGLVMAVFLIIFRDYPNVRFEKLLYVLVLSTVWLIASDVTKRRELFNKKIHFIVDSLVYVAIFSAIYYFTGGSRGDLSFIFSLIAVSAPLFGTWIETMILIWASGMVIFGIDLTFAFRGDVSLDHYHIGSMILRILVYFVIAGIIKYFQINYLKELEKAKEFQATILEKNKELEKAKASVDDQIREKTKELQEQNNYLENARKVAANILEDMMESGNKLQEQNSYLEDARKAVVNILEDVAQSEHDLSHKTLELEKFQQAADASFDQIAITNPDGIILYINDAGEEITGYSKEESIGKNPGKLWGGQVARDVYEKMWNTIKVDKSPYAGEITNKRKDGEKYLASIRISPILDKKGDVKFYVGVERDITEEREAQVQIIRHAAELQKANVSIEKQKESVESILRFLKSIGDGVVATDMEGRVIFFNEAAEKLTGAANEKAIGNYAWETLYYFKESDPKTQIRVIKKFLAGEEKFNRVSDRLMLKRKDGAVVDISFSISYIYDKNKIKQGCILVMRDVTEERELEKTKDNFLSVAAHQLRTPLSGIRWSLEMLLGDDVGKLPEEAHEVVENINENTMRLINLVNDLLNVSRINMGKVIEPASPVGVVETISAVLKSGEGFVAKNKVKIVFDNDNNTETKVFISPQHFFEAIENIVSNAIKYTPELGTIKTVVSQKDGKVRIAIADSGIGIPKKEQEKMFSKFFRAQNAIQKDPDGSGLGLSVVKSFIEEAGGTVSFESEEGKGTTFFIELPVYSESK